MLPRFVSTAILRSSSSSRRATSRLSSKARSAPSMSPSSAASTPRPLSAFALETSGASGAAARAQVGVQQPEPPQGARKPQCGQSVAALEGECERGSEVVALEVQARRPDVLARPVQLRLALLCDAAEVRRVAPAKVDLLAGGHETLERVFADDLEHREPPHVRARVDDQALVGQRTEQRKHVVAFLAVADGFGGRQRPAANKDGEPAEQPPLSVVEQLVAGVDRGAERAVAFRRILDGGGQLEPLAEACKQLAGAQDLYASRGQLDRERQRVERSAEGDDVGDVLCRELEVALRSLRAGDEERDSGCRTCRLIVVPFPGQRQRANRKLVLAGQMEDGAARDEQLQFGRRREQAAEQRRGLRQLLEVVEHKQRRLVRQVVGERLLDRPSTGAEVKCVRDRRGDQPSI